MRRLFILITFLSALKASAQQGDSARMYDMSKRIFMEPISLIDGYNSPSLRLGMEWPVTKNFCSIFGVWGLYGSGNYIKLGMKFYPHTLFKKGPGQRSTYVSLHIFHKSVAFTAHDNIADSNYTEGEPVTYDVRKRVTGFHAELGATHAYRRIFYEPYFGLGIRVSTVSRSISDSLFHELHSIQEGFVNNVGNSNKTGALLPSLVLGIRVGYLFKTRAGTSTNSRFRSYLRRKVGVE